jgi:hypothetical protein
MIVPSFECESHIERVVVYARDAVVTRRVALPAELPAGPVELVVGGITGLAEAGSLRALVDGGREVVALAARVVVPDVKVDPGPLRERVRALALEREGLERRRSARSNRRAELAALALEPDLARRARKVDPVERIGSALALAGLVEEELGRLDDALRGLDEALEDNARARQAAELAAAQGTPAEVAGGHRARLEARVRLGAGDGARLLGLAVEYVVGAARWWPVYTARFTEAAARVRLALDALVAQATGEDWSKVRLSLSTADLAHDARLPELRSLRLGRAQPPAVRGYRPPPEGLDAMFAGFDRAAASLVVRTTTTVAVTSQVEVAALLPPAPHVGAEGGEVADAPAERETDERTWHAPPSSVSAPMAAPPPPPAAAPAMSAPRRAALPMAMPQGMGAAKGRMFGFAAIGGAPQAPHEVLEAAADEPAAPQPIEPADEWLDFDALRLGDPAERAHRGRLVREPGEATGVASARRAIEEIVGPEGAIDPIADRGRFDHRYVAVGTCDVPSTSRPHRVAVASADADAVARFKAVPREAAEVYREAEIANPLDAPLLSGPVDVLLDGALLTTSRLSFVDRGGTLRIGLGVEDRLRVARNVRVEEGTAGLLGGSTTVDHAVTIDLASSLGHEVSVDVVEGVPVTDDKDVEVKRTSTRPEATRYTQAERGAPLRRAYAWRVRVPPGGAAQIEIAYRVTLPAKSELVGGNRRE